MYDDQEQPFDPDQTPALSANYTPGRSKYFKMPKQLTPVQIAIIGGVVVFVVVFVFILMQIFHKNPYGEGIKISNMNKYFDEFSTLTDDAVFNTLHNIASFNNPPDTKLSKSDAKIREGSANKEYNQKTDIYYDTFIVDLESLKQSYFFQVAWSSTPNNPYYENLGYYILATCPTKEQMIYPDFQCVDYVNNFPRTIYDDPAVKSLPFVHENYTVYANVDEATSTITIVINDKTGKNYDAAIAELKANEINPDNYTIVYNDQSTKKK